MKGLIRWVSYFDGWRRVLALMPLLFLSTLIGYTFLVQLHLEGSKWALVVLIVVNTLLASYVQAEADDKSEMRREMQRWLESLETE